MSRYTFGIIFIICGIALIKCSKPFLGSNRLGAIIIFIFAGNFSRHSLLSIIAGLNRIASTLLGIKWHGLFKIKDFSNNSSLGAITISAGFAYNLSFNCDKIPFP